MQQSDMPDWLESLWGGRDCIEVRPGEDFMLVWHDGSIWLQAEVNTGHTSGWYCGRLEILQSPVRDDVESLMKAMGITNSEE